MDYKWTETIETIIGVKRKMNLHSGEELHVPRNMQMIFETSSIEKVFYILLVTMVIINTIKASIDNTSVSILSIHKGNIYCG